MVFFFTTTLAISVLGMLMILLAKRWEMTTGRVLGASVRPAAGAALAAAVDFVEHQVPAILRRSLRVALFFLRTLLHRGVAALLILVERVLESLLHVLRHKTDVPQGGGGSSDFLREVAEHKKKILRSPSQSIDIDE